jgi:hypothetical protein
MTLWLTCTVEASVAATITDCHIEFATRLSRTINRLFTLLSASYPPLARPSKMDRR